MPDLALLPPTWPATLRSAFRRAADRPLRTVLTLLEVALGALALSLALNVLWASAAEKVPGTFAVSLGSRTTTATSWSTTTYDLLRPGDLPRLRELVPAAAALAMLREEPAPALSVNGALYRAAAGAVISEGYDAVYPPKMLEGSWFTAAEARGEGRVMVLTQALARVLFPSGGAVGALIGVQDMRGLDRRPYRVVGVMEDPPAGSTGKAVFLIPAPPSSAGSRMGDLATLAVRARPGQTGQAREQVRAALDALYGDSPAIRRAAQKPTLLDQRSTRRAPGPNLTVILFLGLGAVMLVVAGIGIFSIQLVSALERTREVGMRRALGASRAAIVAETLIESALLAGTGAALGLITAALLTPRVREMGGFALFPDGLTFAPQTAPIVLAAMLLLGAGLGLYPALIASRLLPVEALREGAP